MKKSLSFFLMFVFMCLILFMSSCGTRKRAVQVETTKRDVVIREKKDITTNAVISISERIETYTPVDPTKPMTTPDGKTTTNAKVEIGERKKESNTNKVDKGTVDKKESVKEKAKTTDAESTKPNPWLWIGLTFLLGFIAYLGYRKLVGR